jgi:hypothetical protein
MAKLITTRKIIENKVAILAFISREELQSRDIRIQIFTTLNAAGRPPHPGNLFLLSALARRKPHKPPDNIGD